MSKYSVFVHLFAHHAWLSVCLHARTTVTPECILAPPHAVRYVKIHSCIWTLPSCQAKSTPPCTAPRPRDNGIMEEAWGSQGLLLEESSKLIKVVGTIKLGAGTAVNDCLWASSWSWLFSAVVGKQGGTYNEVEVTQISDALKAYRESLCEGF